jgi:sarcosine oxidase subunit gamma
VAEPAAGSGSVCGLAERRGVAKLAVRGAARDPAFLHAAARAIGLALPLTPCTASAGDAVTALWLGPDEWLVVSDRHGPEALGDRLRAALAGLAVAVTDVSDARLIFRVSGPGTPDLLAQGCRLDLHPRAFAPGACAQTLLARVPVLLHRPADEPDLDVYVGRSYADYLWSWLVDAGR